MTGPASAGSWIANVSSLWDDPGTWRGVVWRVILLTFLLINSLLSLRANTRLTELEHQHAVFSSSLRQP